MPSLEQVFHFTADDLAANEAGYTTPSQRKQLFMRYLRIVLGGYALFTLLFVLMPTIIVADEDPDFMTALGRLASGLMLPAGIFSVLLILYNTRHIRVSRRRVKKICSVAVLETVPVKNGFEYKLHIAGQESKLTQEQFNLLHNGENYYVYFLPYGSQILSIRSATDIPNRPIVNEIPQATPIPQNHTRTLQVVVDFIPQDLAENEAGHLSQRQYSLVRERACEEALMFLMGLFLLCSFVVILGIAANPANDHPRFHQTPEVIFVCFMVMSPVLIVLGFSWLKAHQDIQNGRVEQLCGEVKTGSYMGISASTHLSITIADQRFKVSGKAVNAVQDGGQYCIYYAPVSRVIVSIKPINQPVDQH